MYVKCAKSTAYVNIPAPPQPRPNPSAERASRRSSRATARELESERTREAWGWLDGVGSVAIFAVTLALGLGLLGYGPTWLVSGGFWLFPGWVGLLAVVCGLVWRLDGSGCFTTLRYSSLAVLAALAIPVLWDLSPLAVVLETARDHAMGSIFGQNPGSRM